MKVRTSFAACGVYLSRRSLRISLSRDVTEAIIADNVEQFLFCRGGKKISASVYCVAGGEGQAKAAKAEKAFRHWPEMRNLIS